MDSNNIKHFQKKSRFNNNRDSYVDDNGDLVYLTWVQEGSAWRRREACRIPYAEIEAQGQTDLVIWLDEQDHRNTLENRYAEENADYGFRNMQERIARQDTNDDDEYWATDAWDTIIDPHGDVFETAFPESKVEDPMQEKVAGFLETLTEKQRDLFISRYGMGMQLEEYRRAEIERTGKQVSQQAISDRWKKLMDKAYRYFDVEKPHKNRK